MLVVSTIVALIMIVAMFFISRDKKIALIFLAAMTLSLLQIDFMPSIRSAIGLMTVSFIVSEYNHIKDLVKRVLNDKTLKKIFIILLIMFIIDIIFSPHLHSFIDSIQYFFSSFFTKYFFIFFAFFSINKEQHFQKIINLSIVGMFLLTFFGVVNMIYGRSDFAIEMLSNHITKSYIEDKMDIYYQSQFRVQSMFQNAFDYGYICCICLILYLYVKKTMHKMFFWFLEICCIFGIFMCGCRTVVLCALGGFVSYIIMAYNVKKIVVFISIFLVSVGFAYSFIPVVEEKIDSVTTVFTDTEGKKYGGSNVAMRGVQLATTLRYIDDKPLFGNGVHFFNIELGWGDKTDAYRDSDLKGLEGVYLSYLLEHGWIGYILYLSIWIIFLLAFVQKKHLNKEITALGIAIWTMYFIFAHLTGELLSLLPTCLIIGSLLGILYVKNSKNEKINN